MLADVIQVARSPKVSKKDPAELQKNEGLNNFPGKKG